MIFARNGDRLLLGLSGPVTGSMSMGYWETEGPVFLSLMRLVCGLVFVVFAASILKTATETGKE
jgi:hypothetical protein